jgi:hypothetical protein
MAHLIENSESKYPNFEQEKQPAPAPRKPVHPAHGAGCTERLSQLLLVSHLSQSLLALVRRHLVTLALLSAWHGSSFVITA